MRNGGTKYSFMKIVPVTVLCILFSGGYFQLQVKASDNCPDELMVDVLGNNEKSRQQSLHRIRKMQYPACKERLVEVVLSKADNSKKIRAIEALRQYNGDAMIKTWSSLLEKSESFVIKKQVIQSLADTRNRLVVPELIPLLKSPFHTIRESAAEALGKYGDDRVFPFIIGMSKDENPVYRMYAVESMNHIYDDRLYYMLVSLLQDENKSIRYAVLECIQENEIEKAFPYVRKAALHDDNYEVRIRAMNLLSDYRDSRSYGIFIRNLSDDNADVRDASVAALLELGYRKSAWSLSRQLINEKEHHVKMHIIQTLAAIKEMGDPGGLGGVLEDDDNPVLRIEAAYAIGAIGEKKGISYLLNALKDSDYRVRAEAAYALGNFNGDEIVCALLELLEKNERRYVRSAALYSLNKIGDTGALLGLYRIYGEETDPVMKSLLNDLIERFIKKSTREYSTLL